MATFGFVNVLSSVLQQQSLSHSNFHGLTKPSPCENTDSERHISMLPKRGVSEDLGWNVPLLGVKLGSLADEAYR